MKRGRVGKEHEIYKTNNLNTAVGGVRFAVLPNARRELPLAVQLGRDWPSGDRMANWRPGLPPATGPIATGQLKTIGIQFF